MTTIGAEEKEGRGVLSPRDKKKKGSRRDSDDDYDSSGGIERL